MNSFPNPEQTRDKDPGSFTAILRRLIAKCLTRRSLFVLACLATLVGLFYAVENWRGQRAWEKCRRELEARGEVLNWDALIPPPVPDDQNIYKAPRMTEWFVKASWTAKSTGEHSSTDPGKPPFFLEPPGAAKGTSVVVAEVDVIAPDASLPAGKMDALLKYDRPEARDEAWKVLRGAIGPWLDAPTGGYLTARPLDQIGPVQLVVQASPAPALKDLAAFLLPTSSCFQLTTNGNNQFRVCLARQVYSAADYLKATETAVPDLDVIREALKRPYARMESDYRRPFEHPIPNFVRLRTVAQLLAQRAQCCLLLGQPEAAWHELATVRDLCHILEAKPGSNCPTLVEAMIDVAISGLYAQVIADGLTLHAWREPELAAIQNQAAQVKLVPLAHRAFTAERAGACRTFETYSRGELMRLFSGARAPKGLWSNLQDPAYLFITFAPRGWFNQNMCTDVRASLLSSSVFDITNDQILPVTSEVLEERLKAVVGGFRPYTWLARMVIPNFLRASQPLARNQTLINEAYLACGLERYRLAHGAYPDTLEALVPQLVDKLPHDLIGGQPLKYRRTANDQFLLYSIGWNGKDDGGVAGSTTTDGDWVWR